MNEFKKADKRNPYMGLNNNICKDPKYWCRLHEIWLSENDIQKNIVNKKLVSICLIHMFVLVL